MQTPSLVISHLQMPIVRLQEQQTMPLSMQQQVHMPPASIVHRFCTMLVAILSSQWQWIFIPPVHFSILNVHRGTMRKLAGMEEGDIIPGIPIPVVPTPGDDARRVAQKLEAAVAALADEFRTDWWQARRRAAAGTSPSLSGPDVSAWRRSWARPVPVADRRERDPADDTAWSRR